MRLFSQVTKWGVYLSTLVCRYMLIPFKNRSLIDKLKVQLSSEFEMKDLGEAKRILGIEIDRDSVKGRVSLTRKAYLQKVLQKFRLVVKQSL